MGFLDSISRRLRGVHLPDTLLNAQSLGLGDIASHLSINNINNIIRPHSRFSGNYSPDNFYNYDNAASAFKKLITHPSLSYTTDFTDKTNLSNVPLKDIDLERLRWDLAPETLKYPFESNVPVYYNFNDEFNYPFVTNAFNILYQNTKSDGLSKLLDHARNWYEGE